MNKWKYMAVIMSACMCMSMAACGRDNAELYEKYEGVTEGEGGMDIPQSDENVLVERELNYDTVGAGVSVYAAGSLEEDENTWYPNVDVFLDEYGFFGSEPFYEYTDAGGHQIMRMYYNPETREGCGVRYYSYPTETFPEADGIFGFVFNDVEYTDWMGYKVEDYTALTSVYGGDGASAVTDYEENVEYDESDSVILFESKGKILELVELGEEEPQTILHMEFEYYEDGALKSRKYSHNSHVFPTSMSVMNTQFDEKERVVYEQSYITHGSVDDFYVYEGGGSTPKYCLTLDFMHESWVPVFVEYIVEEEETGETTNAIHFD